MSKDRTIGFIGGGNMGEALIRGLISASLFRPEKIFVHDPSAARVEYLLGEYGIKASRGIPELAGHCGIILLAVKPQVMLSVLGELRRAITEKQLVISIAAGIPLSMLERELPKATPVVRVMPNTPALVLMGASALSRGGSVSDDQMETALEIFRAVGKAVEVEEKWMDTVTGLSGSGPAYVLLMIEAMIDAGVLMGLPRHLARELAVQTFAGTSAMLDKSGKHPAEMKDMITSPGGTTIRGLKILEEKGVRGAIFEAVEAATRRSEELGKG